MKRALLIVLGVALLLPAGSQAQGAGPQWTCSVDDVFDAITLCISAPEPGMRLYITDIVAQDTSGVSGLFNVVYSKSVATGGAANCGESNVNTIFPLFAPNITERFVAPANTSAPTVANLSAPLVVPSGNDLCVIGDPSSSVSVQLVGYVAP